MHGLIAVYLKINESFSACVGTGECACMRTHCVCVCVCVGLYIPAIVDSHRDFYMQTWTFVNRGRPRILEEVH